MICQWFSPGTSVSSTNKTGIHNIIEILLKAVEHPKPKTGNVPIVFKRRDVIYFCEIKRLELYNVLILD